MNDPLAGYSKEQSIQRVRPEYTAASLGNPHKGTATFQRFAGDALDAGIAWDDSFGPMEFRDPPVTKDSRYYPTSRVAYCRWLWSVVEPECGRVRWEIFDGALAQAKSRVQTLQIRIQPYINDDAPAWFWAKNPARDEAEFQRSGARVPDINDRCFVEHWSRLIGEFGARYDGHPDLESVDIAYGGACGETGGNATAETAERLVDVYLRVFRKTPLLSMLGTHGCAYARGSAEQTVGWRADCLGDLRAHGRGVVPDGRNWNHMYDAYPREVFQAGVQDAWRRAPVVFETCWTVPHWKNEGWDLDWILEQALKYHPTIFMPKSVFIPDEWREKIEAFNRCLGYRFHLQQIMLPINISSGAPINLEAVIDNRGVAPIYRRYRFALRFSQYGKNVVVPMTKDIREWMPGLSWFRECVSAPIGFARGRAVVSCAIINETGNPVVKLAQKDIGNDGWHPLTQVVVS